MKSFHRLLYRTRTTIALTFIYEKDKKSAGRQDPPGTGMSHQESGGHFMDLQVAETSATLEEIFHKAQVRISQQQNIRKLAMVAEMMDEWTRLENTAYAQAMESARNTIEAQQVHEAELLAANNQMAAIIIELEQYLDIIRPGRARFHAIRQTENGILVPVVHILPEVIDLVSDEELTDSELEPTLMDELMGG